MSEPADSGDRRVSAITATVDDSDYPRVSATFDYLATASARRLLLRGICVGPRIGLPTSKQWHLSASALRDLPLSRWEAAARARVVQRLALPLDQVVRVAQAMGAAEEDLQRIVATAAPVARVRALYPGLEQSTTPADVRRHRSLVHLAEVAEEFRSAQLDGVIDPAAAIARSRNVNPSTVRSWLHRARKAGLLERSTGPGGDERAEDST